MVVRAPALDVLHAAARGILKVEFTLIGRQEGVRDRLSVSPYGRVDMKVMNRPIGATAPGDGDELCDLGFQIGGD
nr:hypothetical protein [Aquabacter cavernae]